MGQIVDFMKVSEFTRENFGVLVGPIEPSDEEKFSHTEIMGIGALNVELFSLLATITAFKATYSDKEVPEELARPILVLCNRVDDICRQMDFFLKEYTKEIGFKSWRDMDSFSESFERIEKLFGTK